MSARIGQIVDENRDNGHICLAMKVLRRGSAGERMRARMRERGITQDAISEQLRVSQGTICRWQLGERYPTDAHARKLEKLLGIPADAWRQSA